MSSTALQILLVFLGGLITSLSGYFLAVRKTSGRVKTTEAERLWAAAEAFTANVQEALKIERLEVDQERQHRQVLMQEVRSLQASKNALEEAAAVFKAETEKSHRAEERCRQEVVVLEDKLAALEEQIANLKGQP